MNFFYLSVIPHNEGSFLEDTAKFLCRSVDETRINLRVHQMLWCTSQLLKIAHSSSLLHSGWFYFPHFVAHSMSRHIFLSFPSFYARRTAWRPFAAAPGALSSRGCQRPGAGSPASGSRGASSEHQSLTIERDPILNIAPNRWMQRNNVM